MQAVVLGHVEIHILDDGTFPFPARLLFHDVSESVLRDHLEIDDRGKIPVGHNCGLVKSGCELIVVDTGYGDDTHDGRTGHLLEELARTGYEREQITQVVITHAHGDHIKRNTLVRDAKRMPTFPNARYHLARADWDWFSGPGHVPEFDEQIVPLEKLGLLERFDGPQQLTPEVRLLPTPGHTPGHTSVVIESLGETVIFLGDVCHHPLHFSHPIWVSSYDTGPEQTPRTRALLFDFALERNALLICPHAASPGLGRLERTGRTFAWRPEHESVA